MQEHDRSNEKSVITSGYNLGEKFKVQAKRNPNWFDSYLSSTSKWIPSLMRMIAMEDPEYQKIEREKEKYKGEAIWRRGREET